MRAHGGSNSSHGGVKKRGSNAHRFQRASVLKHGNGQDRKGAVKDHSWVAPVSKNRKKKRKEIGKSVKTSGYLKQYRKGGAKGGGYRKDPPKLANPVKFTKKTW